MRGFLSNNWFFIVLMAMCCLGHIFGHGGHGHGGHRHDEVGEAKQDKNFHHKHAA